MSDFNITDFTFTPEEGFLDTEAYPDPSTETQVRTQLMSLHNQIKEYLNTTVKTALISIAGSQGDPAAIAYIENELENLDDMVGTLPTDVADLQGRVGALEDRPIITTWTMAAADWSGTTYSFEDEYSSADYDIEICLDADNADASEIVAWASAQIVGSATTNVVTAYGTVPTSALHIILKVEQKL